MPRIALPTAERQQWRREMATGNVWESAWPRRVVDVSAAVGIAAIVIDVVVTYFALSGTGYVEQNPIAASAMEAIGLTPTLLVAAFLRVAVIGALVYIATRAIRPVVRYAALSMLVGVAIWWCAIDFSNAVAFARGPMGG